jgi:hypothetical protein
MPCKGQHIILRQTLTTCVAADLASSGILPKEKLFSSRLHENQLSETLVASNSSLIVGDAAWAFDAPAVSTRASA